MKRMHRQIPWNADYLWHLAQDGLNLADDGRRDFEAHGKFDEGVARLTEKNIVITLRDVEDGTVYGARLDELAYFGNKSAGLARIVKIQHRYYSCPECGDAVHLFHGHDMCRVAGALSPEAPPAEHTYCNIEGCIGYVCDSCRWKSW
jgi:hypothetical protein